MRFADIQCFAGGLTLGVTQAGMTLVHKAEGPGGFGMAMCEANRGLLGDAWEGQASLPAQWDVPSGGIDVIASNPPCSGFSVMTPQSARGIDSPINECMRDTFAYAARARPAAVIMESVGAAFSIGLDLMRELADGLQAATRRRYHVTHVIQNNLSLGGCTRRRRYFLVVSEVPLGVEYEPLKWIPTVGDAIRDLRGLELSWDPQPYNDAPTWWSARQRSATGLVDGHMDPKPSPRTRERIFSVLDDPDGVDWPPRLNFDQVLRNYYLKHGYLPEAWRYETTSKGPLSHLTKDKILISKDFKMGGYAQTRHWPWDEPGYVMTGHGPCQVWHPDNRYYTHREAARIMGFPDDWVIGPLRYDRTLIAMWGKGVSVDCGRWIGTWVRRSLEGNPGSIRGNPVPGGADMLIDVSARYKQAPRPGWPPALVPVPDLREAEEAGSDQDDDEDMRDIA